MPIWELDEGELPPSFVRPDISKMAWQTGIPSLQYGFHQDGVNYKDKLYWLGGYNASAPMTSFGVYDPVANAWSSAGVMPSGRYGHTSLLVGDKLYVAFGVGAGNVATGALLCYDFIAKTWSTLTACPETMKFGDGVAVGNKLYFFGGMVAGSPDESPGSFFQWCYDIATDKWTKLTNSNGPSPRLDAGVTAYKGKVYLVGGRFNNAYYKQLWQYDPATNTWVAKAAPPAAIGCRRAFLAFRDWLVTVFGNVTSGNTPNATNYRYDPDKDLWEAWAPNNANARSFGACASVGNKIYYFSGIQGSTGLSGALVFAPTP